MALVVERDPLKSEPMTIADEKHGQEPEEDLEDGEIEDDEDEPVVPPQPPPPPTISVPSPPAPHIPGPASALPLGLQLKDEVPVNPLHGGPPPPFAVKAGPGLDRSLSRERDARTRELRRNRHSDDEAIGGKKVKHMTEAEKSILHLRKRERMQREKWEKFRKEQESPDDFAINIEKAIANALKKDKQQQPPQQHPFQDEDERIKDCVMMDDGVNTKRGRKRKNRDKEKFKNKQRKMDSPLQGGDLDENEFLNMRGGSPPSAMQLLQQQHQLQQQQQQQMMQQQQQQQQQMMLHDPNKTESLHSTDSYNEDSEYSSDRSPKLDDDGRREQRKQQRDFGKKKQGQQNKRNRDRDRKFKDKGRDAREKRTEQQLKDAQGFCVFFMQGKCQKNDCPYSHEVTPPMKLELCKFYLKDCCAKGEKCSYMHSEFPCKFYHTGLPCLEGDNCKFAHGKALNEGLRQILFKHIETAPREILGGFPRMSREEALDMINNTQSHLAQKYGQQLEQGCGGGNNSDKEGGFGGGLFDMNMSGPAELSGEDNTKSGNKRNRPSRWQQDATPQQEATAPSTGPLGFLAQDQDMRISSNGDIDMRTLVPPPPIGVSTAAAASEADASEQQQQLDNKPMTVEQPRKEDTDIRIVPFGDVDIRPKLGDVDIRVEQQPPPSASEQQQNLPNLPKTQRDLYLRIQATQKDNLVEAKPNAFDDDDNNINWYSDDSDDENKLTIKVDNDESGREDIMSPPQVSASKFDLGDLSKIDISAEVTKLLSAIKSKEKESEIKPARVDPRTLKKPPASSTTDEKLSIYEQGSLENEERSTRPDVDLRNLALPFKGMANYTPAKEIDASVSSHKPIVWVVHVVDIPRPDYTGLKLNVQDAEKTGDPRLRKIFRLSTEEKDSPMSPKASPKASTTTRIDPRLKKLEVEKPPDSTMNYTQQLNILTSSAFFQSLTSNQKLLLNQELASRNDQTARVEHDPVLNSLLSNLNLIPNLNSMNALGDATAISILQNVNKLNPMLPAAARQNVVLNQMVNQSMVQPGLLGAAPGIPNIPPDFSINFDPRNGGLLGNAPPPNAPPFFPGGPGNDIGNQGNFQGFPGDQSFPADDYYDQGPPPQQQQQNQPNQNFHNRNDNRGFNRDRRRGRNNFRNNNNNNRNNFNNRRNNNNNRNNRNSP